MNNLTITSPTRPSNTPASSSTAAFSISIAPVDNAADEPVIPYNYSLTVTDNKYMCSASAPEKWVVYNPRKVYVPSAFSPGGTSNTLFRPINLQDYPGSKFEIYNRYG